MSWLERFEAKLEKAAAGRKKPSGAQVGWSLILWAFTLYGFVSFVGDVL